MMRKIIIVVVIIVLVTLIGGLYKYYQPQKNYASSQPDYELTVSDLFNAFSQDEAAATKKFVTTNCTIQVKGILHDINHEADSTITIIIKASENDPAILNCNIVSSEIQNLDNKQNGDSIIVKGQCTGYQDLIEKTVYMIRGVIVE
jgi:hypothetical protein